MNADPGTYVLLLHSLVTERVGIGRWGQLQVEPGWYLYVGSAFGPGGLRARVRRHCRSIKKRHWHVDYLREVTSLVDFWYAHGPRRLEHDWAEALGMLEDAQAVTGFGCSDCRCISHLAYLPRRPGIDAFRQRTGSAVCAGRCPPGP